MKNATYIISTLSKYPVLRVLNRYTEKWEAITTGTTVEELENHCIINENHPEHKKAMRIYPYYYMGMSK